MEFTIMLLNFVYAVGGAVLALLFMIVGYRFFDKITPFDTSKELGGGNVAVGVVIGAIFVGLGIAIGLVIGMGLN
ncbi:MAG: DUF350 domain-containing protein [Deltaproteobacteria bacterium]|nr:DUF350 domain-containing protein [Deltaproteobacteria bacterium]MCD6137108.1 DUF350 domain-containing protein [Deltaproteobacteria bacterium]RLB89620.1 MAG: DUF350 domain-containing protein [Deltaproteobacteria bacterium]RLB95153.1 MAG: DUF350 domain-containing protein [Deltaproteobacteria bacterium]RLC11960.1 MAG: DUF350 domain-containing protein [Deltaproteobacteria bacterium]